MKSSLFFFQQIKDKFHLSSMRYIILIFILLSCDKTPEPTVEDLFETIPEPTPVVIEAPTNLTLSESSVTVTKGDSIGLIFPMHTGGDGLYRVAPDLPVGLILDESTGVIGGTPSGIQDKIDYIVTLYNDSGRAYVHLELEILEIAPVSITYTSLDIEIGESISDIFPTKDGIFTYLNIENLPTGLNFNDSSGKIYGTPTERGTYSLVITGGNSGGEVSSNFEIIVRGRPIENLIYGDLVVKSGVPFNILPNYGGDEATEFEITPSLPLGLSMEDGEIKGTTSNIISQEYIITARNEWGEASTSFNLTTDPYISGISNGSDFTCAINNRKAVCWGDNSSGQLGYVSADLCNGEECSKTPNFVKDINNESVHLLSIASSRNSTCGITLSNKVLCWGDNSSGQLGTGLMIQNSIVPLYVKFNSLNLSNVTEISAGKNHFCAKGDHIYCWGDNNMNQVQSVGISFFRDAKLIVNSDLSELENRSLSLGGDRSCINDPVVCWGSTFAGMINIFPTSLHNGRMVHSLTGGYIFNDGLFTVGDNSYGQLFSLNNPVITPEIQTKTLSFIYPLSNFIYYYDNGLFFFDGTESEIRYNSAQVVISEASKSNFEHLCYSLDNQLFCIGSNDHREIKDSADLFIIEPEFILLP